MASAEEPVEMRLDDLLVLCDDLLASIFLRLPTLADIGRAATVCSALRRVIAGRSFLRRLRSVHRAPCLGFLHDLDQFHRAVTPHPSAPYARALARAGDFSFSFLPSAGSWSILDVRDGRVLLQKSLVARDLAVANPCPGDTCCSPHPQSLTTSPRSPSRSRAAQHLETLLAPASGGDEEPTSSFRVICMAVCGSDHLVAYVFSSDSGDWGAFPFKDWSALFAGNASAKLCFRRHPWRYCVDGCLYWMVAWNFRTNQFLVLDMRRMEFSLVNIPCGSVREYCPTIAEADDGPRQP